MSALVGGLCEYTKRQQSCCMETCRLKGEAKVAVSVLFVCLGNICRSPLAEGIFRHLVGERGLDDRYRIDSAGTGGWHVGEPPHPGSRAVAADNGVDLTGQVSRQVVREELGQWDWILAMDASNHRNLARMGCPPGRLRMLLSFAGVDAPIDVPDPYYEGGFPRVFSLVQDGCVGLLDFLESLE